jgi:hypothetical protein
VLAKAYRTLIERHGLEELAQVRDRKNPPIGGLTQKLTNEHFARAFDGSAARAELALLDPNREMRDASNAFIICLAGNKVKLTDAPCGAGAAAFAFLTIIAELRSKNVVPREPLDIVLIGGEISPPARAYAEEMLAEIRSSLEAQAVFVQSKFLTWDVTNSVSNSEFVKQTLDLGRDASNSLLVVANFSGFLGRKGKRKEAAPQINELFRYLSGKNSIAILIEPRTNPAIADGGVFEWFRGLILGNFRRFAKEFHNEELAPGEYRGSSAHFELPLNPGNSARVNLSAMYINLIGAE